MRREEINPNNCPFEGDCMTLSLEQDGRMYDKVCLTVEHRKCSAYIARESELAEAGSDFLFGEGRLCDYLTGKGR